MHMTAGLDGLAGAANDLTVTPYDTAARNSGQRDFVAGGDGLAYTERLAVHLQFGSRGQRHARDGHVVGGMQMDDGILRRGQLGDFEQRFQHAGFYLMSSVSGASSPKWTCSFPPAG